MSDHTPQAASLDVVLLLDDSRALAGSRGQESFLAVTEAVDAIAAALERLGHRARPLSFELGVPEVLARLVAERPDVVFCLGQPVPTDSAGEAQVTAALDLLGLPHTSETPETLHWARDKVRIKALLRERGIPTPDYAVSAHGELPSKLPAPPWIAKPSLQDGSIGIPCQLEAHERATLAERVHALYRRYAEPILIETFVGGRELQVGVLGGELLPVVELDFSRLPEGRARIAGHEAKWKYDSVEFAAMHYHCPAQLSPGLHERVHAVARATVAALGVRRCTRLDLRMDERAEHVYVLDVNPNPDLSPIATMHAMASAAGFGFDGLVQRLLDLARGIEGRDR